MTLAYSSLFVGAFGAVLGVSYVLVAHRTGGAKTAVSIICTKNGQTVNAAFSIGSRPIGQASGGETANSSSCASQVRASSDGVIYQQNGGAASGTLLQTQQGLVPPGAAAISNLTKAVNSSRDHTLNTFLIESLTALGVMALLSIGLGWWISGRALKPVHRITDAARRLSGRNLHDRINLDGPNDELKELADTFDDMLSRLDGAFTSQRRFVANASHELRTPLATERVLVDEALANPNATVEELRTILEQLRANSVENERLINALLTLARSERGIDRWSAANLAASADAAIVRAGPEAVVKGVDLQADIHDAATAGDPGLLERLAGNLVDNAVRHNHPGGWVQVRTAAAGKQSYLEVTNSGPVIDPCVVPGLLQPFRRTSGERHSTTEGVGLGLSIVDAIVTAHHARLELRARPEGGLAVRVEFRSVVVSGEPTGSVALAPLFAYAAGDHGTQGVRAE
jgi:signal transduction histidine kinase